MTVSEGMDVVRVREIEVQLHREADRLTSVSAQGNAQMGTLQEVWAGVDSQGFGRDWMTTERSAHEMSYDEYRENFSTSRPPNRDVQPNEVTT